MSLGIILKKVLYISILLLFLGEVEEINESKEATKKNDEIKTDIENDYTAVDILEKDDNLNQNETEKFVQLNEPVEDKVVAAFKVEDQVDDEIVVEDKIAKIEDQVNDEVIATLAEVEDKTVKIENQVNDEVIAILADDNIVAATNAKIEDEVNDEIIATAATESVASDSVSSSVKELERKDSRDEMFFADQRLRKESQVSIVPNKID